MLDNWYSNGGSLTIKNNCSLSVTYYLCVSRGSDAQELRQCATDPFDTPSSQMRVQTLTTGPYGYWYQSTRNVTVHVFYCSDEAVMRFSPLRCVY